MFGFAGGFFADEGHGAGGSAEEMVGGGAWEAVGNYKFGEHCLVCEKGVCGRCRVVGWMLTMG